MAFTASVQNWIANTAARCGFSISDGPPGNTRNIDKIIEKMNPVQSRADHLGDVMIEEIDKVDHAIRHLTDRQNGKCEGPSR